MAAPKHQQAADHFDAVTDEHDLPFGSGISKSANPRRKHDIEKREHRHQCGSLPIRRLGAAQQRDCDNEQGVVGQRAEKLRCHDGVEAALHVFFSWV